MILPRMNDRALSWLTARPIAHRGLHAIDQGVVENTQTAFARAIAANYAIECDLQLSADGEAMVFHDRLLDRLTGQSGAVAAHTVRQLGSMRFRCGGDRMQTLSELLRQIDGQVPVFLEMKSLWDGNDALAQRTCAIAGAYAGPVAVMSFDPEFVSAARRIAPDLPRGLVRDLFLQENWPQLDGQTLVSLRDEENIAATAPDFLSVGLNALDATWVKSFRDHGGPVICWTVRSPDIAAAALNYCDQVTFEGYSA